MMHCVVLCCIVQKRGVCVETMVVVFVSVCDVCWTVCALYCDVVCCVAFRCVVL